MTEYLEPTSKGRLGVALVLLASIAAIVGLHRYSANLIASSVPLTLCDELAGYRLLMQLMSLALLVPGGWLALYGRRILKAGKSPPPGAWVLHRVQVKTGAHVTRVGWMLVLIGGIVMLLPAYLWSAHSRDKSAASVYEMCHQ